MIQKDLFKIVFFIFLWNNYSLGQFIESGKIIYERKTNLLKLSGQFPPFLQEAIEKKKYNVDEFVLIFNKEQTAFIDQTQVNQNDYAAMLTSRNSVYTNFSSKERMTAMDMMGTKVFIKDTISSIPWIMTDNTRKLAGFNCRMAIYKKDDSTRLYAWYADEIIPSIGPETFFGLPGAILGLATEDGSIVYFAKSVEIKTIDKKELKYEIGKTKVYSKQDFIKELIKQMGNSPMTKEIIASYFKWY